MAGQGEVRTVVIEAINAKGIKANGEWLNFSKYAENLPLVVKGQVVTVTLDKDFIMSMIGMSMIGGSAGAEAEAGPATAAYSRTDPNRERTITRLAVLKAACEFLAPRPNAKLEHITELAATLETWVNREEGGEG